MASHETLCWKCQRADGKCRWSREFKPVEGWLAIPTKVKEQGKKDQYITSFNVYACPEFELLARLKEDQDGVQG
jgi:hypothetical protein